MTIKKIGSLEIDQEALNPSPIRWIIQLVAHVVLFGFVLMAGLGLFGQGGYFQKEIESQAYSVNYDFFGRQESDNTLIIHLFSEALTHPELLSVTVDENFFKEVRIESISPQPVLQKINDHHYVWYFALSSTKGADIIVTYRPEHAGNLKTTFLVNDLQPISIHQFIYP